MVISSNSRNAIQILAFGFHFLVLLCSKANAKCSRGCDLALASYYVWDGSNLTYIRKIFGREISEILKYNPQIENQDSIDTGSRINVPFRCDCLNGDFLGHTFEYTTQFGDTYDRIAERAFSNLTTEDWVHRVNEYPPTRIPDDVQINVTVNCSCGNRRVSMKYGLFATYPLRDGENLSTVAAAAGITDDLVRRYNPAADFSAGTGLVFVPAKESKCSRTCDLALASYNLWKGVDLNFIATTFSRDVSEIQSFNPQITNIDLIIAGERVNVPFSCGCIDREFLGTTFVYSAKQNDTYSIIAEKYFANLTTVEWLQRFNTYAPTNIPIDAPINVTVNCSCGNSSVSKDYGLFVTYPLEPGENLSTIANQSGLPPQLLQDYNPDSDFSRGSGLVFIPGKDQNETYPPLKLSNSAGISSGVIAGISVAGIVGSLLFAFFLFARICKRKKVKKVLFFPAASEQQYMQHRQAHGSASEETSDSAALVGAASLGLVGITVDKSVEFSYEELATATDNFSLANKIGQGGFGSVYYAELRGEKAAIKKMDMQASKEFLAELKVLTHVHHLNLVRLIGYCVEGSLFLVYEFIDNGNLSHHLRGSGKDPLPWSSRVQIALDSARGLEYIHEHTVPVYIHRDIKPANILIDKKFRAKVADFGLTKLTEVGSASIPTRLVGTFGYMPPEYAQYGDVSPKIDVFAFGVVLYELISAKEAIVKTNEPIMPESKGLVALFEDVLSQPDPREDFVKLIDQRLGDDYPLDSIWKMAHLAKACTQENPQLRPSMRSIVVALMTLSSSTEDWDVGSFYENEALMNLMSGR
uniref:non-specific serine/threonine protein kinase n=1 Tax=Vitis vinifera TaxID=29760 RepID=F6H7G0_VITVI